MFRIVLATQLLSSASLPKHKGMYDGIVKREDGGEIRYYGTCRLADSEAIPEILPALPMATSRYFPNRLALSLRSVYTASQKDDMF